MPDGNAGVVENWISWIEAGLGHHDEAVTADLKALAIAGISADARERLHTEYMRNGWISYWKIRIEQMLARDPAGVCAPYDIAVMYVRIGNADAAFPWLHKAVDNACVWDTFIRVAPKLDAIRADRRFDDLLARIHQASH